MRPQEASAAEEKSPRQRFGIARTGRSEYTAGV